MVNRRIAESLFLRGYALGLLEEKRSAVDISRQLRVSLSTIWRWRQEHLRGKVAPAKSTGRPLKTTVRSNRLLLRLATQHHLSSASDLLTFWREQVTVRTVYRRLMKQGLRKRRRLRCPILTRQHREVRLRWCMTRIIWREPAWSRVIFTDESRFSRISDGCIMVWRRKNERYLERNICQTVQGKGGSVHVWGAIWAGGRSRLHILEQTVNQHTYIQTVTAFFNEEILPANYIFQDDNAPAHRAAAVARHFQTVEGFRTIPWPARSPDLNPIEHVWQYIKRRLNSRDNKAENLRELRQRILDEWREMPQDFLDSLVRGMPRRLSAVIGARGGHTKY